MMLGKAVEKVTVDSLERRVADALQESCDANEMDIVEVIPEVRTVVLNCKKHGHFAVNAHAAIRTWRLGSGAKQCPTCKEQNNAQGAGKRVSFPALVATAKEVGLEPAFEEAALVAQTGVLPWRCMANSSHKVLRTAGTIDRGGCELCEEETRSANTHKKVMSQAQKRGDVILSTRSDFKHGNSMIEFKCGHCGETVKKRLAALLREGHACRRKVVRPTAKDRKYRQLRRRCERVGLIVVTSEIEYTGVKGLITYREAGEEVRYTTNGVTLQKKVVALETMKRAGAKHSGLMGGRLSGTAA